MEKKEFKKMFVEHGLEDFYQQNRVRMLADGLMEIEPKVMIKSLKMFNDKHKTENNSYHRLKKKIEFIELLNKNDMIIL